MVVAAACAGADEEPTDTQAQAEIQRGGTLQLALESDVSAGFDPQKEYYAVTWEYYRCCLLRTLLSYNGKPGEERGNDVFPDLAKELPTVSQDSLTWTFELKEGINYAPPFEDREIVADDFIYAMERESDPEASANGYSFYYSPIEGFDDAEGQKGSITGMRAVDDHTLEITLNEPTGDFGFRMAMPASAPIPRGAAEGHTRDYGRFLVASGPYMFEGSEDLDFSLPPEEQSPVSGYRPGRSITLVRNPSYDPDTDDLREAYVDVIETTIGGTTEDTANQVEAGTIDMSFDGVPPAQQLREFQADPERRDQVHVDPSDGVRYLSMNLALPPFDDIAVRRALNYVIDKDGLRRIRGGPLFGEIAGHAIVNTLLDGTLDDYDPYETPNGAGDVEAAKEQMRQSKYDADGDGVCDAPECKDVLTAIDDADPYPDQLALIEDNLEQIGITLDSRSFERTTMYNKINDPAAQFGLGTSPGWFKDYVDAATFGEPLFGAASIGPDSCCNYSLVGAAPQLLQKNDYAVTEVPSVDNKIEECEPLLDEERIQCWTELDQMIMEDVVPWVPYLFDNDVKVVSDRIVNYTHSQFAGLPALDRLALAPDGQ
jgi:peptide/nickel transport system substrate-binding protein